MESIMSRLQTPPAARSGDTATPVPKARALLAGVAGLAVLVAAAVSTAASAEPPMWVVEDDDSTIYLFGTVHLLNPDIEWRTARVMGALDDATEVWFEIPMPATIEEMQAQQAPVMLPLALSPGRPLSSLLTDDEKTQLERALARAPNGAQLGMALENMKPWFATVTLGVAPLLSAGYEVGAGADLVLAGLAHAQGDAVMGFETVEQQLGLLTGGAEEEQLETLRAFLAIDDEEFDAYLASADAAFRSWMDGETAPLEAIIQEWRAGAGAMNATMSYAAMLADRNANWAGQIETLLAGEGVAFVAVGGGHLVGPDSVQAQLASRGIEAKPY
jgi:hypothetical protein